MIVAFDTNVLVYAAGDEPDPKARRARELLEGFVRAGRATLLLQTLIEFGNVGLRKIGLAAQDVGALVDAWCAVMPVHAATKEDLSAALAATAGHRLHFFDALLWATARRAGVRYLLSEDFQDGRSLEGVRFVNPFASRNDRLIERILAA